MDYIVDIQLDGRCFTFTVDWQYGRDWWRVESDRGSFPTPLEVSRRERPRFFRELARSAILHYGL